MRTHRLPPCLARLLRDCFVTAPRRVRQRHKGIGAPGRRIAAGTAGVTLVRWRRMAPVLAWCGSAPDWLRGHHKAIVAGACLAGTGGEHLGTAGRTPAVSAQRRPRARAPFSEAFRAAIHRRRSPPRPRTTTGTVATSRTAVSGEPDARAHPLNVTTAASAAVRARPGRPSARSTSMRASAAACPYRPSLRPPQAAEGAFPPFCRPSLLPLPSARRPPPARAFVWSPSHVNATASAGL